MLSKEEKEKAYWKGYIAKQNEAMEICKQCKYIKKARELESDKQKLIEKLEKVIKETAQNINPETMKKYQNVKMEEIDDETYILLAMHRIGFAGEILEFINKK